MVGNKEKIEKLSDAQFQELFGVKKPAFYLLIEVLERKYSEEHKTGGRPGKLSVLDRLVIMLKYYRDYPTMGRLAYDYDVSKSTISEAIDWTEKTLIRHGNLPLPKKRKLEKSDEISIDVTEVDIERSKNRQNEQANKTCVEKLCFSTLYK